MIACSNYCQRIRTFFAENTPQSVKDTANLVYDYVKDKWPQLVGGLIAWGVIITGFGVMHGFSETAIPLTIGFAGGIGGGALAGVVVVKMANFDDAKLKELGAKYVDTFSVWGLINQGLNSLDANGTRVLVISTLVTILVSFVPIFPYPGGGVLGFISANYMATNIGYYPKLKALTPPEAMHA